MSFGPSDPRYAVPPQQPSGGARSTRNRAIAIGLSAAVVAGLAVFGTYMVLETSEAEENRAGGSSAQDGKQPGERRAIPVGPSRGSSPGTPQSSGAITRPGTSTIR
ncbi:hypothetical protein ABID94_000477 [Streptomyces sp. PvR018]